MPSKLYTHCYVCGMKGNELVWPIMVMPEKGGGFCSREMGTLCSVKGEP